MKYEIKLPISLLRAAYSVVAMSDNDSLAPFSNVFIKDGHIIGTNGHLMFYSKLHIAENIKINLPANSVKHFLTKLDEHHVMHLQSVCTIEYDTENKLGSLKVPNHFEAYEYFEVHLNEYDLNWKKILPKTDTAYTLTGTPTFQGKYIVAIENIASLFGSICMPIINSTGDKTPAVVEFKHAEVDYDLNLIIMAKDTKVEPKCCIAIYDEPDDTEPSSVKTAESLGVALRSIKRIRDDLAYRFDNINFAPLGDIRIRCWQGTEAEFKKDLLYTEEWLKLPLRRYDDADKAKEFMRALNEPVGCYVGDISITANTPEEVDVFFLKHIKTPCLVN